MNNQLKKMISFMVFGSIASVLTGFIFFGRAVFFLKSPYFQFVSYGVVGSVSFALFNFKRYRDSVFVSILLFLIFYFSSHSHHFITHFFYFLGAVFSVFIFSNWIYEKLKRMKYVRPLILAGIFSIFFVAGALILTVVYYSGTAKILSFRNMPVGFLIGLGLGMGFELSELVNWDKNS